MKSTDKNNPAKVMIGLEIHLHLNTESKMFCACPTKASEPNSACCPTCLGLPGAKPVLNRKALEYGLKLALALNCRINQEFFFSRKTYFYPDMSKNYQITQYEKPIAEKGFLELKNGKRIGITRVHLEEDPAALVHKGGIQKAAFTLVDYNRAGIPLAEVVTDPDLSSPSEAREFMQQLLNILSYLGVYESDAVLKADANISSGSDRVEIKNITGFKSIERALCFELERQQTVLGKGEKIVQHTRLFDEETGKTVFLRGKESEEDYGYIADPDLPTFSLEREDIEELKAGLPELHFLKAKRLAKELSIPLEQAEVIVADYTLGRVFEETAKKADAKLAADFFSRELLAIINHDNLNPKDLNLKASDWIELLSLLKEDKITAKTAKETAIAVIHEKVNPAKYIKERGWIKDLREGALKELVEKVLGEEKEAVKDFKQGNQKSLHYLVGKVMRLAQGKADPNDARKEVERALNKKK